MCQRDVMKNNNNMIGLWLGRRKENHMALLGRLSCIAVIGNGKDD